MPGENRVRFDDLGNLFQGFLAELFADCGPWIGRMKNIMIELHAPYDKSKFLEDIQHGGGEFWLPGC